jgi:hypothetical protein
MLEVRQHQWPESAWGFHHHAAAAILEREQSDPGLQVANVSGWHSRPDLQLWPDPAIADLIDRISQGAAPVGADGQRMHVWANVMRAGAHQLAHRHGEATWSGVYYLDAGEAGHGGEITFASGQESCTLSPRTGLMLIFPGALLHSVAPYCHARPRISVAFNLFP